MHACVLDNEQRERGKITLKKENQSKQTKDTVNSVANMQD